MDGLDTLRLRAAQVFSEPVADLAYSSVLQSQGIADPTGNEAATAEEWRQGVEDAALQTELYRSGVGDVPGMVAALRTVNDLVRFCTPSILPTQQMIQWPLLREISVSYPPFGSLSSGTGLIGDAEASVLRAHNAPGRLDGTSCDTAEAAYLFVDGSTGALRAVAEWIAVWHGAPVVGIGRSTHKAIPHHLDAYQIPWFYIESAAGPAARDTALEDRFRRFDAWPPVQPAQVTAALLARADDGQPAPTHLILNSVTYAGASADLAGIAEALEGADSDAILIADEAWGAHFPFDSKLSKLRAIHHADIVTTSVHKQGGASQGTAALLVAANRSRSALTSENARKLQATIRSSVSTSPNFPMIASVQAATDALVSESPPVSMPRSMRLADDMRRWLASFAGLELFSPTPGDPLKVVMRLPDSMGTGFSVSETMLGRRIVPEQAGYVSLTLLVTFSNTYAHISQVLQALISHANQAVPRTGDSLVAADDLAGEPPSAAARQSATVLTIPFDGTLIASDPPVVSADFITPFPPGIPLVVPGTELTSTLITRIAQLGSAGAGLVSGAGGGADYIELFVV